jgi:hypothetical protein
MSEDAEGWHREMISQLHDADKVVDAAPVGPRDKPERPDYITVTLAHGNNSEVLDSILGYEQYVILSAYVGDSGELILDITAPKRLHLFYVQI